MVEIIEVKKWTLPYYAALKIRLQNEDALRRVAKTMGIEFIFKKGNELLCIHGLTIYWYKP